MALILLQGLCFSSHTISLRFKHVFESGAR
jgi:hypothetical protein